MRKQLLLQREAKQSRDREQAKLDAEERLLRKKSRPIRNEEFREAQKLHEEAVRMRLEENMRLLEGLEAEYAAHGGGNLAEAAVKRLEEKVQSREK